MAKIRIRDGEPPGEPGVERPGEPREDMLDLPMSGAETPAPRPDGLEPTRIRREEPDADHAEPELRRAAFPNGDAAQRRAAPSLRSRRPRKEKPAPDPATVGTTKGGVAMSRSRDRSWLLPALVALVLGAAGGFFANRHPAVAVLSEDLLDFGEVRLAETSPELTFNLTNNGQRHLAVAGFQVSGEGAAQFHVVDGGCTGLELRQHQSCPLRVTFTPSATGPQAAVLEVLGEAANPARLPLRGLGVAPLVEVEPAGLDFGKATVGYRSRRQTLRFLNRGSAPLQVASVSLDGDAAADFNVGDECSGATLAPGEHCQLSLAFVPTATGERRATVRLLGADDSEALAAPPELVGQGLAQEPSLRLEPERVDFADLRTDTAAEQQIVLTNKGTGPLKIKGVGLQTDASEENGEENGAENGGAENATAENAFTLDPGKCRGSLRPGGSCTLKVGFVPRAEGTARAFVEIRHDAGRGLHRVPLVGNGIAPHVFLDPTRLDFGEVAVGAESPAKFLRLVNSGTGPLTVEEVRATGKDAAAFIARPVGCTTSPIQANASCGVEVRFRPIHPGEHDAALALLHDAAGETDRIPLDGRGAAGRLSVDKPSLDFGEVHVTRDASRELVLRNSGRARMTVEQVQVTGRGGSEFTLDDRCSGTRLPPGESCRIVVRFAPTTPGGREAVLRIVHNAADRPQEIPLKARATPPPVPQFRVQPAEVSFGEVLLTERPEPQTIRVTNPGTGPLLVRDLRINGEHSLDYRIAPGTCESGPVPPGGSCTVGIRFVPGGEGVRTAFLELDHNAAGSPARLRLTATAVAPPAVPPEGGGRRK